MKRKMAKRLLAALVMAVMVLALAACGGGDSGNAGKDTDNASVTKEEYAEAVQSLSDELTKIQEEATKIDINDLDAARDVMESMKEPIVAFKDIVPPEEYVDAHAKMQSGCDGMLGFIDDVIGMIGETDQDKLSELAESMQSNLTNAITDLGEGASMLEEANQ